MQVPGVQLDTEDIEGGAALVFTTTEPAHVEELRALVRAMVPASEHQEPASAEGLVLEPPAALLVVDVPGGARLDLRAEDPSDIAALRRQARMRADLLLRGACPLLPPQHAALDRAAASVDQGRSSLGAGGSRSRLRSASHRSSNAARRSA